MKHMIVPTEFKALGDAGTFEGYASMFGNVDLGGDVVERGAFKEFVKNDDGKVVVLWQHGSRDPIGVASVKQDDVGLRFSGELVLEDATARKAYAHMKAKSVRGMSIGYDVLEGGAKILESGIRKLTALKLWEISVVTFGMNVLAGVDTVKSMPQFETIRECEIWLRDELGFTHGAAKEFIARFKKALVRDEPPRDEASAEVKEVIDFLKSIAPTHS